MNKKVYVDLSQQDVQDIINAYEKDIEKFNKQKEVLDKIKEISNQVKEEALEVENEWTYQVMKEIDYLLEEIE